MAAADPIVTLDGQGTVLDASSTALSMFGVQPSDLIGRNVSTLLCGSRSSIRADLERCLRTGDVTDLAVPTELEVPRKDGTAIVCELRLSRVDVAGAATPLFVASFRDTAARKDGERREAQMLKALSAIGESASVLLHDIKNPITGIQLAIRAVAQQLGEDEREVLSNLVDSLNKLERTMRRTLSFAKPIQLKREPVSPRQLLDDVLRRARAELVSSEVQIEIECPDQVPHIDLDRALMEEALLDLVKNALEAVGTHGRVRLTARISGSHLGLAVEDDGPGLSPSMAQNVFKPFHTTKDKGSGLGLAICTKITEAHGGEINTGKSALGGTLFTIRLPLSRHGRERTDT